MDEFIDGINDVRAHVIAAVQSISERISPERFFQQIDEEIQSSIETLGTEIQSSVGSGVDALRASAAALATCSVAVRQDVEGHREAIASLHAESCRASASMFATLSRGIQDLLEQVKDETHQARIEAAKLRSMQASLFRDQAVAVRTLSADNHRRTFLSMFARKKAQTENGKQGKRESLGRHEAAQAAVVQQALAGKRGNGA